MAIRSENSHLYFMKRLRRRGREIVTLHCMVCGVVWTEEERPLELKEGVGRSQERRRSHRFESRQNKIEIRSREKGLIERLRLNLN